MRLATIRTGDGTRAVRIDDDDAVETGHADLDHLLGEPDWQQSAAAAAGARHSVSELSYAPLIHRAEPGSGDGVSHRMTCEVDGELMQEADTADLVFSPVALVSYISSIITLMPGDLIATGTPSGVGHARTPPLYLIDGAVVVTRIEGIGECRNACIDEK